MVWRTTLITISTCFLLGTTFTHWIADHNVLWRAPLTEDALAASIIYYSLLASAPPWLGLAYICIPCLALLMAAGRMAKVLRTGKGEVVFDGGSIVLLASITYTQLNDVYPAFREIPSPIPADLVRHPLFKSLSITVRELASDNIKTAVMLTGVMLLQAGRYYVKRPAKRMGQDAEPPATPPETASPPARHSPLADRAATPYRELTEEEALELTDGEGRKRTSTQARSRKR